MYLSIDLVDYALLPRPLAEAGQLHKMSQWLRRGAFAGAFALSVGNKTVRKQHNVSGRMGVSLCACPELFV